MFRPSPSPAAIGAAGSRHRDAARAVEHSVFIVVPALLMVWLLVFVWRYQTQAVDFRLQYLPVGLRVLRGASPYAAMNAPIHPSTAFPYPAATALLFALFAAIPGAVTGALYVSLCIAAPLASLWVLGVRDWRLYGFVLMLGPVIVGWQTANLTLPLVFGVALTWRYRDRPLVAGLLVALLVSLKPFLWPLALWLIATRRYRAASWGLAAGALLNVIAWAIVGFDRIRELVRVMVSVTNTFHRWGYSTAATAMHLGASRELATWLAVAAAAGLATACIAVGRRDRLGRDRLGRDRLGRDRLGRDRLGRDRIGRDRIGRDRIGRDRLGRDRLGRDRIAMLLACDLMLAASPIVWSHYFALMIVPLAILSPRLSTAWVLQLAFWCCPVTEAATWQCVIALLVTVTTSWLLVRRDRGLHATLRRGRRLVLERG